MAFSIPHAMPDPPVTAGTATVPADGGWVDGVWAWASTFPGGAGWLVFWAAFFTVFAVAAIVVVVKR